MTKVKIKEISVPQKSMYIRVRLNEDHLKDLALELEKAKPGTWPFPPIQVCSLSSKSNASLWKKGFRYQVTDGQHRLTVAMAKRLKEIPAEISTHAANSVESVIDQFKGNEKTGLKLDLRARAKFLLILREKFKLSQRDVMAKVGLSQSQVSRILRGVSGTAETAVRKPHPSSDKPTFTELPTSGKDKPTIPTPVFSVDVWVKVFGETLTAFTRHKVSILEYLKSNPLSEVYQGILKTVAREIGGSNADATKAS